MPAFPSSARTYLPATSRRSDLALRFAQLRANSLALAAPLSAEDQCVQSMPDAMLHALYCNPLLPAYQQHHAPTLRLASSATASRWIDMPGGTVHVGHGGEGFAFDNETPRHPVLLAPYRIADRLVSCGEYAQFIAEGGYVLRGGSIGTPAGHTRPSYRNFFPPAARWQFSGLRLARNAQPC